MTRYAVLLRAVNVGGHNKVPMARLRELATDLGYRDVETYVQSGNLVLTAPTKQAAKVETAVSGAIKNDLGLDIDVMARSRAELAAIIAGNPFEGVAHDPAKLLVSALSGQPSDEKVAALDRDQFLPERFEVGDRCLYMWLPNGAGRSKLATAPWDRRLGVRGTGRNWRTVLKLLDLLDAA